MRNGYLEQWAGMIPVSHPMRPYQVRYSTSGDGWEYRVQDEDGTWPTCGKGGFWTEEAARVEARRVASGETEWH